MKSFHRRVRSPSSFFRKKKKPLSIMGVSHRKKNKVVDLRPRDYTLHVDFLAIGGYFRKHIFTTLSITAILGVLFIVFIRSAPVKADVATFYPQTCLGGWDNPHHAEGKPDLAENSDPSLFTDSNSASLKNTVSQLFCGNFKGEFPQDSEAKRIVLSFNWTVKTIEDTKIDPKEDFTSSAINAANPPATGVPTDSATPLDGSPTLTPTLTPKPTPSPTEATPVFAPAPNPTPTPNTIPAAGGDSPITFLNIFAKKVFAEEAPASDNISTSTDTTSTPAIDTSTSSTAKQPATVAPVLHSDSLFTILYTLDSVTWKTLGTMTRADIGKKTFELPADDITSVEDLTNLQINIQSNNLTDQDTSVYLDGITLSDEYEFIQPDGTASSTTHTRDESRDITHALHSEKQTFKSDEAPKFKIDVTSPQLREAASSTLRGIESSTTTSMYTKPKGFFDMLFSFLRPQQVIAQTMPSVADVQPSSPIAQKKVIKADILDFDHKPTHLETNVIEKDGIALVTVVHPQGSFRPGTYHLAMQVATANGPVFTEDDFTWGVLAVNTDKSIYAPRTPAHIQLAALDNFGHTLCDASLELSVTDPAGHTSVFTTDKGDISKNNSCGPNNVTDLPDYSTHYDVGGAGTYTMKLKNNDTGYQITDTFYVQDKAFFTLQRIGATRINPYAADYAMTLHVSATRVFDGEVVEYIPSTFSVSTSSGPSVISDAVLDGVPYKKIAWEMHLKKGESADVYYVYRAPLISPQLFTLGEAELVSHASTTAPRTLFQEKRLWQIASDSACVSAASGSWSSPGTWTTCASSFPGSGDTVSIAAAAHIVNVDVNSAASSIVLTNPAGVANGITFTSGKSLTVGGGTGTITIPASTGAGSSTVLVDAGLLSSGTITIAGGASTGATTLRVTTGSVTVTGSITPSGTAANARVVFTGAGTISLTGNFGSGGTLTTGSTGTIILNGSSAQTLGTYTTYNNITTSNTSGGVTLTGATTCVGFSVTTGTSSIGAFAFTTTGTTTVSSGGALAITSATGAKSFNGDLWVQSGGTWNNSTANVPVTLAGNILIDGSFLAGIGTYTLSGAGKSIGGASAITATTLFVSGTITNTGTITTALSGGGGFTNGASSTLNIASSTTAITTLTATAVGNTVNYSLAGAQTCAVTTYYNLTLSGSGAKTCGITAATNVQTSGTATWSLSTTATIAGNLTIDASTSISAGAFALTVSTSTSIAGTLTITSSTGSKSLGTTTISGTLGLTTQVTSIAMKDLTIASGGTMTFSVADTITITGDFTMNGTASITGTTGLWTFQKTGGSGVFGGTASTVSLTSATFNTTYTISGITNVYIDTLTPTATTTNQTTLTVRTSLAAGNFNNSTAGYLRLWFTGTPAVTNFIATTTGNTVEYGFAGTQNILATTYSNLTLASSSANTSLGSMIVNGTFTMSGSATWAAGTSLTHTFAGSWVINTSAATPFTFTTASTINFNTPATPASTSITGTTVATLGFNSVNINNTSGFSIAENMSVTGTMTVAANVVFTPTATSIVSGSGTLTGSGTAQVTRIAATPDFSSQYSTTGKTLTNLTVDYTGTAAQTISTVAYGNLLISNTAASTTLAATTTVTGNVTANTGSKLDVSASSFGMTVGGNWTMNGSYGSRLATTTLNASSGTKTITLSGAGSEFYNLSINGAAIFELQTAITTLNNLQIVSGSTLDTKSGVNNAITVAGNWSNAGTFTARNATVTFSGSGSGKTLSGTLNASSAFYNLAFNGSGSTWNINSLASTTNSVTITAGGVSLGANNITVGTDLNISTAVSLGTLNGGSATIMVGGNFIDTGSLFTPNTSTVNLTGTGSIDKGNFFNVTLGYPSQTTTIISTTTNASGTVTLKGGTVAYSNGGSGTFTIPRTTTGTSLVFGSATSLTGSTIAFKFGGTTASITHTIPAGNYGTWGITAEAGANSITYSLGGTITTTGSITLSALTFTGMVFTTNSAAITANYIYLSKSPSAIVNLGDSIVTLTNGIQIDNSAGTALYTLNMGGSSVTMGGNMTLSNGSSAVTVSAATSTLVFNKAAGTSTLVTNSQALYKVTFNGAAVFEIEDALTTSSNLSILAGTLNTGLATSSPVTVAGNWLDTGTYIPQHSTTTFNGTSQFIYGTSTFYNFVKSVTATDTLTFATTTQTIQNVFKVNGIASGMLLLRSTNTPTQWRINPQGTRVVSYVDVKDSNNINVSAISAADGTNVNSLNNTNWLLDVLSCNTNVSSTDFSALDISSVKVASQNATTTLTCGVTGCTLFAHDAGNGSNPGLYAAAATTSPIILSTTATLSAGTEGYGIQAATSSNGTGAALTLSATYLKTGNNVGGLALADTTVASSSSSMTSKEVVITHKAAVSALSKTGSYVDTITYSCVSN